MTEKRGILMVCLGNICRSPIAEAVFKNKIENDENLKSSWFVDSCGTGNYHIGCYPDSRALNVLSQNNVKYEHRARQLCKDDFEKFDFILGMDDYNIEEILRIQKKLKASTNCKIEIITKYFPNGPKIIEDPYYDRNDQGFKNCFNNCSQCANNFFKQNP